MEENIKEMASILQKECHSFIDDLSSRVDNFDHEAAFNIWLFKQLATLQMQINEITNLLK